MNDSTIAPNHDVWVDELATSWRNLDPTAIAALFTTAASYHRHPFRDPLVGRDEIAEAWTEQLASGIFREVRFGTPVIDGDRGAVEWWSMSGESGVDVTQTGVLFLTFTDGLCSSLREVWMDEPADRVPYRGWGT